MKRIWLLTCMMGLVFGNDGLRESTIPVLDLQDYFNPEKKEQFIEEVKEACHKVGFFGLKNTKVNQKVIDSLYSALEVFFNSEKELKMEADATANGAQRGYTAFGKESAKGSTVGDFKEYYMMGRDLSEEEAEALNLLANLWPKFMDFETPAVDFYNQLEEYSVLIQEVFSLAVGEEKDFFKKICTDGDTSCRMIHYPLNKTKIAAKARPPWAAAHTDIDLFTILPKATCEGLEVCDDQGNWISVYVKEDAMIVNCGDFLEGFTNGYFTSSLHRVIQPENMKTDRYSSVFFVHPRSEGLIYPLTSWIEKTGGVAKYVSATRWELLMERLADMGIASDYMLKDLADKKVMERLMTVGRASTDAMQALVKARYASEEVIAGLNEA